MIGQHHDHAAAFFCDALQGCPERPVGRAGVLGTDQITQRVDHVHAHQRRVFATDIAHHHGHVHAAFDAVFVAEQAEGAVHRGQFALADSDNGVLGAQPVMDQVGDGADTDAVLLGEQLQVRATRHCAVVIHDLDNHRGRGKTGHACQVATRFGVPGAGQHAAVASA